MYLAYEDFINECEALTLAPFLQSLIIDILLSNSFSPFIFKFNFSINNNF